MHFTHILQKPWAIPLCTQPFFFPHFFSFFFLNAQIHPIPFTHHLQCWLPLPFRLCFEAPPPPPYPFPTAPPHHPGPSPSPPHLHTTSVGAKQSQQWLDPGIYERSSLISLGQEQHTGSNQRHKLNFRWGIYCVFLCVCDVVLFLWPVKLSSWGKKKTNPWKPFYILCFVAFPCELLKLLALHFSVTRENNKVIKSVWGVLGCGWYLDTVLRRLRFPVRAVFLYPLTYCISKAFLSWQVSQLCRRNLFSFTNKHHKNAWTVSAHHLYRH